MQYRQLLNADLRLSEIGLGCASFWGMRNFSEKQAINVVHQAIDSGVNYFDTGHSYSGGHAEVRLGKAIHNKHDLIISSKAGTRLGRLGRPYNDFSPQWIKQSCEQSLQNLNVDHLPIFFLHGPNPEDFTDELFLVLEQLQQAGKIGIIGVNAFADHILEICLNDAKVQAVMLDFNLYKPERLNLIEKMHRAGKDVVVAGALAGAIYADDFWRLRGVRSLWYWLRAWKNNAQLRSQAQKMRFLNELPDMTATQAALAYVLKSPLHRSALVGTTRAEHLAQLLKTKDLPLNERLIKKINAGNNHEHNEAIE